MIGDFRSLSATLNTLQELDEAIAGGARESRVLEFRQILPKDQKNRSRFLRTACALANTVGGVIVFGVQKDGAGVYKAGGLREFDFDAAQRQLGQTLLTGTEPPPKVAVPRVLSAAGRDPILVYPVPPSLNRPHGVLEHSDRATFRSYWLRGDGYNFGMTTDELRDTFLEYDHWLTEAGTFRESRVRTAYRGNRAPYVGAGLPHIFAHVVPLGRRRRHVDFSLPLVRDIGSFFGIPALAGFQDRANADGWLYLTPQGDGYLTWVQCFRSGALEFGRGFPGEASGPGLASILIRGRGVERRLVPFLTAAFAWLQRTETPPPYALSFAVTGATGFALWAPDISIDIPSGGFDRDLILLDEMVFDSLPAEADQMTVARMVRPALDLLWQASGYRRSPYFAADGSWQG